MTIQGGEALAAMVDVTTQLVHAPSHGSAAGSRPRGKKRPFTEPNALAEIATYANRAGGRATPLPPHDMVEDLFFLIAELEAGGLQLHEPLPGTVEVDEIQEAVRRLQHCQHLLVSARDQSLRGKHRVEHTQILGGDPRSGAAGGDAGRQTRRGLHD